MKKPQDVTIKDLCSTCGEQLVQLDIETLPELPHPYEDWDEKEMPQYPNQAENKVVTNLDGTSVLKIKEPETEEEKQEMVEKFLAGVDRLFSKEDNWTFLQPFLLSIDNCIKCNTCADACPVFEESGRAEIYRPLFRAETLRRIAKQKKTGLGKIVDKLSGSDLEITWESVARLAELSYRCTLCRRCAQACPMGVDNGLITRELRKLFSQEMGIHPPELHEDGTIKHLSVGSSTGMNPMAFKDIIEFVEEDIEDKTGLKIKIPMDKEGADILIMHNAGEFLSWPENLMAFTILFDVAGLSWTLSTDLLGYDSVNYGLFYDDVQYARVTLKHAQIAKELKVKKVVMGECGHAHKAFMAIGDRMWLDENNVPRESALTLMEELVFSGKLDFEGVEDGQHRQGLEGLSRLAHEEGDHGVHGQGDGGGQGQRVVEAQDAAIGELHSIGVGGQGDRCWRRRWCRRRRRCRRRHGRQQGGHHARGHQPAGHRLGANSHAQSRRPHRDAGHLDPTGGAHPDQHDRGSDHGDQPDGGPVGHPSGQAVADQQALVEATVADGRRPGQQDHQGGVGQSADRGIEADQIVHQPGVDGCEEPDDHPGGDQDIQGPGEVAQLTVGIGRVHQGSGGAHHHDHWRLDDDRQGKGDTVGSQIVHGIRRRSDR